MQGLLHVLLGCLVRAGLIPCSSHEEEMVKVAICGATLIFSRSADRKMMLCDRLSLGRCVTLTDLLLLEGEPTTEQRCNFTKVQLWLNEFLLGNPNRSMVGSFLKGRRQCNSHWKAHPNTGWGLRNSETPEFSIQMRNLSPVCLGISSLQFRWPESLPRAAIDVLKLGRNLPCFCFPRHDR